MYEWKEELEEYFDSKDSARFRDIVAVSKLNREIEDFLIEKAIPAFEGLKNILAEKNRSLYIDKDRQSVSAAVRFGDTAEFVYTIKIKHIGDKAVAIKSVDGKESIIEPQVSKNDNSIDSLTQDDIRSSFVFEYIASITSK